MGLGRLRDELELAASFMDLNFRYSVEVRDGEALTPEEQWIYDTFLDPLVTRPNEADILRGPAILRYVRWAMVWVSGAERTAEYRRLIEGALAVDLSQRVYGGSSEWWSVIDCYLGNHPERDRIKAILVGDDNSSEDGRFLTQDEVALMRNVLIEVKQALEGMAFS